MKLGKKPARKDAITLKLRDYVDLSKLPKPPRQFGHETLFSPTGWGMLGNDKYGDCVLAGGAHETMMWNAEARRLVAFTDNQVLSDYSAITGFNPNDPNTDQGTDVQEAAKYRQNIGLLDAHGARHKVGAYLAITPGDYHEHLVALYLFSAVGIGIEFPKSAMDQFNRHLPWAVEAHSPIEGGHYVPLVAHRNNLVCVTWGNIQHMTEGFFKKYNDESVAYLSPEMLTADKSPEGFNLAQLQADLAQL